MTLPRLITLESGALTWTSTIPQRPWNPKTVVLGGGDESWAGVPEAWPDRVDSRLSLTIRMLEPEWPSLRAVLVHAQSNADVLTVTPESTVPGTAYDTYLTVPALGEDFAPTRGQYPGEMEITIEVRSVDGTALEPAYY